MAYSQFSRFLTRCACGATTSKKFAAANGGKCKACVTGIPKADSGDWRTEHKRKTGHCEDAPCCGCCGPQGDGDYYGTSAMERAMDSGY
jgi:hypothetical protein